MQVPTTAMIVAGGRGTRLLPLTRITPKPMLPFCGAPMLAGLARRLRLAGVRRLVLIVGADPEPFAALAASLAPHGIDVQVMLEQVPLDTAGGVRRASLALTEPYLVLNGDVLSDLDVTALARTHARSGAAATLALTRVADTSAYGVCVVEGERIVDFVEKPAPGTLPGQDAINAGAYLIEPGVLSDFPDGPLSFERTVFPALVADGRGLAGHVTTGVWSDLGTPERFLAGQRLVLAGALSWPVLDDLGTDPEHPGLRCGRDVTIAPGARIVGSVVLGDGVVVEAGAVLGPGLVAAHGVHIGAGVHARDALLDQGVTLGRGAQVSDALIGAGARIGAEACLEGHTVVAPGHEVADGVRADGLRLGAPTHA
jgi:mannose-1-phosphate guanylyltransferase